MSELVIKVPNDLLELFLEEEFAQSVRLEDESCDSWQLPTQSELDSLRHLVSGKTKSRRITSGSRIGSDHRGAFLQENHLKRYFGILRSVAPVVLSSRFPDVVAATGMQAGGERLSPSAHLQGDTIQEILGNLLVNLPCISKTARETVLRTTFQRLDKDNSGELSRMEVLAMIRRLNPRITGRLLTDIMDQVDKDKSQSIQYEEFLAWLQTHDARDKCTDSRIGIDIIHASFRVWDEDGNGLITKKELGKVMRAVYPNMTTQHLRTLWLHLDADKNDVVDYEEFIDYIFPASQHAEAAMHSWPQMSKQEA